MKALGILKFEDIYEQQCIRLVHDIIYKQAPNSMENLIDLQIDQNEYSLRNNKENPLDIKKSSATTKVGKGSFSYKGPCYWNNVPNNLREISKREIFKKKIKGLYLNGYSDTVKECKNPRCPDLRHHGDGVE